jgi:hypothetical protein
LRPWREGDPVGAGEVYLPDSKTKQAYTKACKDQMVESAARHVLSLPSLEQRRAFIANHPAQEELKHRVRKLWEEKK